MPFWNANLDRDCRAEMVARSLHLGIETAREFLGELELERCYDDNCRGQMQLLGTEGAVKDENGAFQPRKTYYECQKCGERWIYLFESNTVAHW